jgi:hypothetical protein
MEPGEWESGTPYVESILGYAPIWIRQTAQINLVKWVQFLIFVNPHTGNNTS